MLETHVLSKWIGRERPTKKKPPRKAKASDELEQQTRDNVAVVPLGLIKELCWICVFQVSEVCPNNGVCIET